MTEAPSDETPSERLLTPGQTSELLGIDPKTVTRWADTGRIPVIRLPSGHRRFPESAVRAMMPTKGKFDLSHLPEWQDWANGLRKKLGARGKATKAIEEAIDRLVALEAQLALEAPPADPPEPTDDEIGF